MLSCLMYRKHLGSYLDGELSPRRSKAVSAHVARCKSCRVELKDLNSLAPVMRTLEVAPVPAGLANHVMALAHIRAVRPQRPAGYHPLEWWRMMSAPLRFAACATVLLAFFLGMAMSREVFLSGDRQVATAGVASMEGFEWFSQTPPASLAATYLTLSANEVGGMIQ